MTYEFTPDPGEAEGLLKRIDPRATQFTFVTYDDDVSRMDESLTRVFHEPLAMCFPKLIDLNQAGAGVFFVVNETDLKGREPKNIVRVRAFFVNADGVVRPKHWGSIPIPTIVVQTSSPLHWHAYWRVDDATLEEFSAKQRMLAKRYGTDVETTSLNKVMRVPGFCNWHCKGVRS